MDGYLGVLAYNFILVIDICSGEVNHDINNEHDVNWKKNILKKQSIMDPYFCSASCFVKYCENIESANLNLAFFKESSLISD